MRSIAIEYTFKIILAIIVVVALTGILLLFKDNITGYIKSTFGGNEKKEMMSGIKVDSMESLANYVLSCYQSNIKGSCAVIQYVGRSFTCQSLKNYLYSMDKNIIIGNCNDISTNSLVEIYVRAEKIIDIYAK